MTPREKAEVLLERAEQMEHGDWQGEHDARLGAAYAILALADAVALGPAR